MVVVLEEVVIREQETLLLCIGRRAGGLLDETLPGKERRDEFELGGLCCQCDGLCSLLDSIAVSLVAGDMKSIDDYLVGV